MTTAQRTALIATTLTCVLAPSGGPHHSNDQDSIMWPFVHADARCARHGIPYLKRAAGPRRKDGTP